jgi:hypothetical protein
MRLYTRQKIKKVFSLNYPIASKVSSLALEHTIYPKWQMLMPKIIRIIVLAPLIQDLISAKQNKHVL